MFDFRSWLKGGLVDGYRSGEFSGPGVITMTANYIAKGMLTETDASDINTACQQIDADKAAAEQTEAPKDDTGAETSTDTTTQS